MNFVQLTATRAPALNGGVTAGAVPQMEFGAAQRLSQGPALCQASLQPLGHTVQVHNVLLSNMMQVLLSLMDRADAVEGQESPYGVLQPGLAFSSGDRSPDGSSGGGSGQADDTECDAQWEAMVEAAALDGVDINMLPDFTYPPGALDWLKRHAYKYAV